MAATIGLAVALSRTSPPSVLLSADAARDLLGYDLPPELTVARLASLWRLDLFFALAAAAAAGLYLAGVVRLRKRGDDWPKGRLVAWLSGVALVVIFTQNGIGTYAPVLFSMHMVQHLGLAMFASIFLVLGAPGTLASRVMKPAAWHGDLEQLPRGRPTGGRQHGMGARRDPDPGRRTCRHRAMEARPPGQTGCGISLAEARRSWTPTTVTWRSRTHAPEFTRPDSRTRAVHRRLPLRWSCAPPETHDHRGWELPGEPPPLLGVGRRQRCVALRAAVVARVSGPGRSRLNA